MLQAHGERGDDRLLSEHIERFGRRLVYPHFEAPGHGRSQSATVFPELTRDPDSLGLYYHIAGGIRFCPVCFTNYWMQVTSHDPPRPEITMLGGGDWVIRVDRWLRLDNVDLRMSWSSTTSRQGISTMC